MKVVITGVTSFVGYTKSYASHDYDLRKGFALNVEPLGAIFSAMAGVQGAVILTGTVAEYADSDQPHLETETCAPAMPYWLSKLMETLYARQLSSHYDVPARVARLFLPFGPLDAPEKLLATVITSLREALPLELTTCLQQRDFLHVDEVVDLYLKLLPDLPRSLFEIYNVCAGESPTLREVILEFAVILGVDAARCEFGAIPMRTGEPSVIRGSNEKARKFLQWTPAPWRETVRRWLAQV